MPENSFPVPGLTAEQMAILTAVKSNCERLLNHTPRFKFFTLHGTAHLNSLFEILALLRKGGIDLNNEELFLLSLSICIHDLGMVISLQDKDVRDVLDGMPTFPDTAALENYVRETHHQLVEIYLSANLDFLLSLGLSPAQISLVRDISKCHRKVVLQAHTGMIKYLGALLRVIDELDIGNGRAPADVMMNTYQDMDATSCWHWYKHNIVEPWVQSHTVEFSKSGHEKKILFTIVVHPTRAGSIPYWLKQTLRPISKALIDDGAKEIIRDRFGVEIQVHASPDRSSVGNFERLAKVENKALSANQKVILVIDDEYRKMEDLFLPVMDDFHVIFSGNAKDALSKLAAVSVDLAIIDMQIGSGFLWTEQETQQFKTTGCKICQEIQTLYPNTKIAVLTGTRHTIPNLDHLPLQFFIRKPVDPAALEERIRHVLS